MFIKSAVIGSYWVRGNPDNTTSFSIQHVCIWILVIDEKLATRAGTRSWLNNLSLEIWLSIGGICVRIAMWILIINVTCDNKIIKLMLFGFLTKCLNVFFTKCERIIQLLLKTTREIRSPWRSFLGGQLARYYINKVRATMLFIMTKLQFTDRNSNALRCMPDIQEVIISSMHKFDKNDFVKVEAVYSFADFICLMTTSCVMLFSYSYRRVPIGTLSGENSQRWRRVHSPLKTMVSRQWHFAAVPVCYMNTTKIIISIVT